MGLKNDLFVAHVLAKDIESRQRRENPLPRPDSRWKRYQAFMDRLRARLLG